MHTVKELHTESKLQDEGTAVEEQSDKSTKESSEHFSSTGTEARPSSRGAKAEKLEEERDCPQQREAVIRPQQAGKIDFSSLQNRSKFATDRSWSSSKGSPQSPSGKGRNRDKGKRSGKADRGNPQQLHRLSITNPRSNNPIGIAYPQQKILPPKKLESSRGPVLSSYRFHIPTVAEREAELQQEELSFSRCFQEASSNLTSPSYTSQVPGTSGATSFHPHTPLSQQQQQQPSPMENSNAQPGSQLLLADFQLSGSDTWQSSEKTFNGANYGVSSLKSTGLTEANKTSAMVSGPFQYGYNFLEESTSDSLSHEQNHQSQDFTDSIGSVHVSHNSFAFTHGEGQTIVPNSTQFNNEQQSEDASAYSCSPQPQYIQGVASYRNLNEDSASSESSASSLQQLEQGKAAMPENTDTNGQADRRDAVITLGIKRNCLPKETAGNQRTFLEGSGHHPINTTQGPGSHMHFSSKTFNNPVNGVHTGSIPINNKLLNRLPHSWEAQSKAFSPTDQKTIQYSDMAEKFQFQDQPTLDQRPNTSKNSRVPWQQIRQTSHVPNRQISNQKLAYIVSPTEWQDDSKSHKHSSLKTSSFQSNRSSDGFSNQRQETVKHSGNTVSTFKVEMNQAQVCETKNKVTYFGINQSLPVAARNYNYPPLQVPPLGLMMVSPYESPLPSPVNNPTSSSTCSSLSPASTSPVNISSDDSQMSKSAPSHTFYHQPQTKPQLTSDHLGSHNLQLHSDASRNLPFATERAKDEMVNYLQNTSQPKTNMDGNKSYIDSFGVEHHQPPPPYSAHQLLASSLATANLDQFDILLTCKQCDQNFSNLASFLGHKQYCSQHTVTPNELKEMPKMDENRKFYSELSKPASAAPNVSMTRCPSELHLSLLGLNKNGELTPEAEAKGDCKDDPNKLNLFSSSGNIPAPLPDLELEDAKLDSLITEALNGLGYQSDNAEIDSSFIDAFTDDELTTMKSTSNKQCLKTKEYLIFENKNRQTTENDKAFTQGKYFNEYDVESPNAGKQCAKSKLEKTSLEQDDKINIKKEVQNKNSKSAAREKTKDQNSKVKAVGNVCKSEDEKTNTQKFILSNKFSAIRGSTPTQVSTSPTPKSAMKESKRKGTRGGTWSKELIHKIVQQKNKLHKLHVKGTKSLQFSLVMERLTPTVQNPAFGEYDYVSDSDDDCEPVKIASQGRLNQGNRCKYTYSKECKRGARIEREQAAWQQESKESLVVKKSEEFSLSPEKHGSHQRLRRRGSKSSTSSEVSTSMSVLGDSVNSPKCTDRTDSDSEKKTEINKSSEQRTYERDSPQKLCKGSSTLALTFTKSVKKCNTDRVMLSDHKSNKCDPKKNPTDLEIANPVSSFQKSRDMVKNSEKNRMSQTSLKEKQISHQKESRKTLSSDVSNLQRFSNPSSKEEVAHNQVSQFDFRETNTHIDKNTRSAKHMLEKCNNMKVDMTLGNNLDTPKPASLCTSLMDEVCLSPSGNHSPLIQKDTLQLMPFPLDQEQGLMKSPLSFDTSSMFGDLAGFDSGLYSEMSIQKDSLHQVEDTTDKKEEFISTFSPFLEGRDWNLIVSPVLPDEISQYKENTEKTDEKKPDFNNIPLSLPEKIIDYSANLNSCASEDELEIKRIVTELENQLQTTKLESPPLLDQDVPKQLQMSKFSPLRLDDETESQNTDLEMRPTNVQETRMPSVPFTQTGLPWSSPFAFELVEANQSPHTSNNCNQTGLELLTTKDNEDPCLTECLQKSQERCAKKAASLEAKEKYLEEKRYTENLMKSLEVISDSIFKEESIIVKQKEVTSLTCQQHQEFQCQTADVDKKMDHSEKEANTETNILCFPSYNGRKNDIDLILNDSPSSLTNGTHTTVHGQLPIPSEPSGPCEVTSKWDVPDNKHSIPSAHCSAVVPQNLNGDQNSFENTNAGPNLNQSIKINRGSPEHLTSEGSDKAKAVSTSVVQSPSQPSSPPLDDLSAIIDKKMTNVTETPLEDQASNQANTGEQEPSHVVDYSVENSAIRAVEPAKNYELVGLSISRNPSPALNCGEGQAVDLSHDTVPTKEPSTPILENIREETYQCSPFQDTQSDEGQHCLLALSHPDTLLNISSCGDTPFDNSLKPKTPLAFDTVQKDHEILQVQEIKEHLPDNFLASHQNSPCREEVDKSQCTFLHSSPSSNSFLSTLKEKNDLQEDMCQMSHIQAEYMSVEEDSGDSVKATLTKDESQGVSEMLNSDEQLNTNTGVKYSLISSPHLNLTSTKRKISTSEDPSPSPFPPVTQTAQQQEAEKEKDQSYDFKLSPLNYNSISDEHAHLNQYDYIPISPAGKTEDNAEVKQSLQNVCDPCDWNRNPPVMFDQAATDTKINADPVANVNSANEPLQQHLKLSCFSLGLPADINSRAFQAEYYNKDLDIDHDLVEPTGKLDGDLLKNPESVNLDCHTSSAEDIICQKDISESLPTSLTICEIKERPLPADLLQKVPPSKTGQFLTTQNVPKEIAPKKTQSNSQQGKVLCEICLMGFRTVPGLKRHKAMKHLVRAEKHSVPQKTSNHQGNMLMYEESQTLEKEYRDESQICYMTKIDGLPETSSTLISQASETELAQEKGANEKSAVAVNEKGPQNSLLPAKTKKNNKAKKNKSSEINIMSDPFSDEILNILKTDILQAITPGFKSSGLQEQNKSADDQVRIPDSTGTGTEEFAHPVTSGIVDVSQLLTKPTSAPNETVELNGATHAEDMKCSSLSEMPNREDNDVEGVTDKETIRESDDSSLTPALVKDMCEQKTSDENLNHKNLTEMIVQIKSEKNGCTPDEVDTFSSLNSPLLSPSVMSSDLSAILEDDATFSQLFPRNEEAKRNKCPRVYSKKNKRQKLLSNPDGTKDCPTSEILVSNKVHCVEKQAEHTFSEDKNKHCEYETISIDDAIKLKMCHNSSLTADAKPSPDVEQNDPTEVLEVIKESDNSRNLHESTIDKSSIEWNDSADFTGFNAESRVIPDPRSCKAEAPVTQKPLPLPADPFPVEPCVTENVQPFHSIDIQSIKTTFQLPEAHTFNSNDVSVSSTSVDVENKGEEKLKKVSERRGRKRQDGGIKVKDKQYKCKVCFTWFLTLGELNFHKLSHNPSPPPTCYMCVQRKFSSREQLRDHLREKHAKNKTGIWTCGMCLKEISDVWMYNEHLREHATQFARRGQSQGSILDISGCFMQETAVKNFITSIMQHRPSRVARDTGKVSKEQESAVSAESIVDEGKPLEGAEPKVHKTKSSSGAGGKHSAFTPLEVLHSTETTKSVEMHPNCKDPSRDCHHCGKQFPKPFKLQRHLVVHNLEKIFLCHKCPVSYQEAQALKEHLKQAHEEVDELDSKHTTLYTCELCADVMHVIKKSFICSTCNYTFSKKEQFDRHMEKHLSGGNKIFKFRGVLRPVRVSTFKGDECDSPASKKRRIISESLQESSSDSGIASLSSVHLNQNSDMQSLKVSVFTADDSTQTAPNEYLNNTNNNNVKTEDVEDYSELLVELEKSIHIGSSNSASPKKEEVDMTPSSDPIKEGAGKSESQVCDVKEETESVCIRDDIPSWSASRQNSNVEKQNGNPEDAECLGDEDTEGTEKTTNLSQLSEDSGVSVRENLIFSNSPEKHEDAVEVMDQQLEEKDPQQQMSKDFYNDSKQETLSHCAELDGSSHMKSKSARKSDNTKNTTAGGTKAPASTPIHLSISNEDKDLLRPHKKRKETKSPHSMQKVSSAVTQENYGVDCSAKKKFRPSKCPNSSAQRKSDKTCDYPVLSSVRDDIVSNKIDPKSKTSNMSLQSKRSLLDSCSPKKAEIVNPLNGEYKTKKGSLGRPLHPPISKVSSVAMNISLNKSRPKMGVRSVESHSYRTAESQNNLLSQLFGQKLTSFKIPLRKDSSESIN